MAPATLCSRAYCVDHGGEKRDFAMLFGRVLGRSGLLRKWRLYRFIRLRLLRAVRSARDDRLEMIW